ncbi:MAG: 50S ribosomal protein L3 [Nitrospinae bacterium CG11_big_fil_rev_8_21_14_0_20_45_15]|nr:MAG: 50S ribosomal protein L3 [Nitrospinae bacterium CG11_big_fil_rev_8_21_14_0_20_45_15]
MEALLAKKIGMTQVFSETGDCIPVTIVQVERCVPILKKTIEKDGYQAVLTTYGVRKEKHTNKPLKGFYDKHKVEPGRLLTEFRDEEIDDDQLGKPLTVELFAAGDRVDVIGTSKGKGFAGVMKRFNFAGAPASRGSHEAFRGGGSIGMHTYPGRVWKGKKMPGHMGNKTVRVQNLKVFRVDVDKNVLFLNGAAPGPNGQIVKIIKSKKGGR